MTISLLITGVSHKIKDIYKISINLVHNNDK
jgi:hypothetical protein